MTAQFPTQRNGSLLAAGLLALLGACTSTGARAETAGDAATPLNLTPYYDLDAEEASQFGTWEVVPKGRQVFHDIPFEVGGMIRLFGQVPPPHGTIYRDEVTGIPVGRKFEQLHILHGTGWTTEDGVSIAQAVLHYADGGRASFPIIYGEHVRDWWHRSEALVDEVSDPYSAVAWRGEHDGRGLRFYRTSFTNPHPDREVATLDLVSEKSPVTPAFVAVTVGPAVPAPVVAKPAEPREIGKLLLRVVDAETGDPVANASLSAGYCDDRRCQHLGAFTSTADGTREIEYPAAGLRSLSISVDADERGRGTVGWNLELGETVPAEYTVELRSGSNASAADDGGYLALTVEFVGPEDEPAAYEEVRVRLHWMNEAARRFEQAGDFTSRDNTFTTTFENLRAGQYHLSVFTGAPHRQQDASRPGAFATSETLTLAGGDKSVTVRYKPFDPDSLKGDESARGRVVDARERPVADLNLRVVAELEAGRLEVAEARTDADGFFEVSGIASDQTFVILTGNDRLGRLQAGADATFRLAPQQGELAPDIEFIHLESGETQRLSDFRGKVVVLDFWATWCGPCQEPMAKMQTYRDSNPDWGDRVELIALSIDDAKDALTAHLDKKDWHRSYNAWAGGGFGSDAPRAFAVTGIPSAFIIDRDGSVVTKGHPSAMDIPSLVNALLEKP